MPGSFGASTQTVWQRHRQDGEELILAIHADGLRSFHRATVLRWILAGKIPAIKIGRRFLTCQSLVDEWISTGKAANNTPYQGAPIQGAKRPSPKTTGGEAHAQALESLRKKGLIS
jgi:excisionase family DNA binding protein